MKDFEQILNDLERQYHHNNKILTYNEVLADNKLTNKLLKENLKLKNICEEYELYKKNLNEVENLKKQTENLSEKEKILFNEEISELNIKIHQEKQNILFLLSKIDAKKEKILIQINSSNKLLLNFLLDFYKSVCKNNSFVHDQKNDNEIEISGNGIKNIFEKEIGIHKVILEKKEFLEKIFIYDEIKQEKFSFNENDIKIESYHSSGAGGQNINKVSTAIRITHLKSKIIVNCQNERSQLQNKEKALALLKEKVISFYQKEVEKQILKQKQEQLRFIKDNKIIRTYNFDKKEIIFNDNDNNLLNEELKKQLKMEQIWKRSK